MSIAVPTAQRYEDASASLGAIEEPAEIVRVLDEARRLGIVLDGALNRLADREKARVVAVDTDGLVLRMENFQDRPLGRHRLSFELDGKLLSFEAVLRIERSDGTKEFSIPQIVFLSERRETERTARAREAARGPRVALYLGSGQVIEGEVLDEGASGLGLVVQEGAAAAGTDWVRIRFLDGANAEREVFGEVRHSGRAQHPSGWTRIGLRLSEVPGRHFPSVERINAGRTRELASEVESRLRLAAAVVGHSARSLAGRVGRRPRASLAIPIVDFRDARGERIRAIIDCVGNPVGAPAVLIPPAWGKTKETLSPLAETILETFRRAGAPVVVARYDGIRRKGESFNEPDCMAPGREFTKFTISQALRDIRSMLELLHSSAEYRCRTTILITFSASAIEGRRAVALEGDGRLGGWISVVGAPDLQYAMRVLSGGIDYYGGLRRGFRFGEREVLGTLMDIDAAGLDAIENGIASLEDSRRDMAQIRVPITWIHGQHDGWMSLERVREVLGCGEQKNRRLVEIPTGHQLKSSREALETFRLIAAEVGRMALGRTIRGVVPSLSRLEQRRTAERGRLPRVAIDFRSIWKEYLVGRDGQLGIELMTASEIYGELMSKQVSGLRLMPGCRVADLGSGTGALARFLSRRSDAEARVTIDQVDLIREGLVRSRERLSMVRPDAAGLETREIVANLSVRNGVVHVPLRSGSYDRVLAGLVVSYLDRPEEFLAEARRLLKPGGWLVVSSLRRDADISKIYCDGIAEMSSGKVARLFGPTLAEDLDERCRRFLNDGARILDLEERGYFRFWDEEELAALVRAAGFAAVHTERAFGDPPQAVVVSGQRR